MNNLNFFEISKQNCEINLDFSNPKGKLVIPETKEITNALTDANHKLIELITTYKILKTEPDLFDKSDVVIKKIIDLLDNTEFINYTAFCVYFRVLRYSFHSYSNSRNISAEEKFNLIKTLLNLYIENRHDIYLSHGYSDQVLQIMSDVSSSRRQGATGTNNLASIMESFDILKSNSFNTFCSNKKSYILPDKGDSSTFKEIIDFYNVDFNFRKNRDNKNPDMVFKIGKDIYIVEHKLTNGVGGSQNMEINELISFIGQKESNINIHYISCLQGNYFKRLNENNTEPKAAVQFKNIIKNLKTNSRNYFVNELGLFELLRHINL